MTTLCGWKSCLCPIWSRKAHLPLSDQWGRGARERASHRPANQGVGRGGAGATLRDAESSREIKRASGGNTGGEDSSQNLVAETVLDKALLCKYMSTNDHLCCPCNREKQNVKGTQRMGTYWRKLCEVRPEECVGKHPFFGLYYKLLDYRKQNVSILCSKALSH